jgi:hypothetical protein
MTTDLPDDSVIPRTKDGRPLIIPLEGGKPKAYTRSSTFARALDDGAALMEWKQRMLLKGVLENPGLIPEGFDPMHYGTSAAVLEALMDAAGAHDAANFGTAMHNLAWLLDFTEEQLAGVYNLEPHHLEWLDRYHGVTEPLTMVEGEIFAVNDAYTCAGTMDRLARLEDGRIVVCDIKTGSLHPREFAVQLAVYATSMRYNHHTGERTILHPDLDPTVGIIIHVPAEKKGVTAPASLIGVDLTVGLELASLALTVRRSRTTKVGTDWRTKERADA